MTDLIILWLRAFALFFVVISIVRLVKPAPPYSIRETGAESVYLALFVTGLYSLVHFFN